MKLILMLYNERIRIIFGIFCLMFKGSGIAISGGFTNIDTIAIWKFTLVIVEAVGLVANADPIRLVAANTWSLGMVLPDTGI